MSRSSRHRKYQTPLQALDAALDSCGGAVKVAAELGISFQAVYKWRRDGQASHKKVLSLVKMAKRNGLKIRPYDLRPDLYQGHHEVK